MFERFRLKMKYNQRLGAFVRFREQGLTAEQAKNEVDKLYPPTPEDIAYEAEVRRTPVRGGR